MAAVWLLGWAGAVSSIGQGAVNFNNKVAGVVDAPILLCPHMRNGAGEFPGLKVQLMLVGPGGAITAVGDLARFRTNPPAATGYFDGGTVIIPGNNGTPVTLRLRYWTGASYESSLLYGQSHDFTVTPTLLPYVPADLTGLGKAPIYAGRLSLSGCPSLRHQIVGNHAIIESYWSGLFPVRACLKIPARPATRDFGCGRGGPAGASPQRAVTVGPTKAPAKRPAAGLAGIFRQALSEDVIIRESYEGRPVTGIEGGAFRLTPSGLSKLRSVYIPQSINKIGTSPFGGCYELHDIEVDSRNGFYESVEGALFDESLETLIQYPAGRTNTYAIPEKTQHVAEGAFLGGWLRGVTMPDSVLSVGHGAFQLCRGLRHAVLGASVTNIGAYAFSYCVSLVSVVIPDSVSNVGSAAFWGNTGLTSAIIGAGIREVGSHSFGECSGLKQVLFTGDAPADFGNQFLGTPATVYYLPGAKGWGPTFGGVPTAVWDPRAEAVGFDGDGFGFGIRGAAGLPVVIEAAGSLAAPVWEAVGTNVLSEAGLGVFREANAAGWPSRFYRFRFP